MRRITDLKPRQSRVRPAIRPQPAPLDLRGKGSDPDPTSRHIIDLNQPSKNRQQLLEQIRRNSFFEAIPMASVAPLAAPASALELDGPDSLREDWSDRLRRYDQIITTSLARWRRHWRSNRRRWGFEAAVFLTVARQRLTAWGRDLPWRRLMIALLVVAAIVAAVYGFILLNRGVNPGTSQQAPAATNTSSDTGTSEGGRGGTTGTSDGLQPAATSATPASATNPAASGGSGSSGSGGSLPTGGGSGGGGTGGSGGASITPPLPTPTPTPTPTPIITPPPVTVPPVTVPPITTPILETPQIETPGISVPGGIL